MKPIPPRELELLFQISIDLSASFSSQDRHQRLVEAVESALPVDAVTLMRHSDGVLFPVAQHGLSRDALGRDFPIAQHPRLQEIVRSTRPTIFPHDSDLPDPFDGLVLGDHVLSGVVHACVGCPLVADGRLIGVLTLDALEARQFETISPAFFSSLAALAGASLRTALLIEELEAVRQHQDLVASDQNKASRQRLGADLIGDSTPVDSLRSEIKAIGPSDFPVLITGETGAGKEPTVRKLHEASARADKPLIYVNCAALPESLAESELFGHAAGSFTDAHGVRLGKFQLADGASLFLDEIGELPLSIQPKLLRILQSGEVQRVGSDEPIEVDVRLFAATNRDL
ncbi:MAG: sigma 54-interacting transcriptional regulator, partial [Planctomycetota bacterium]|nr:sigma 54-interacting transcriptional regulator [Planctomycetota bacterium]